uniref:Variant erythrocyte surface antigen-1, alpha subunit n=1 Tax=Babesia bovis TaxID=5865 RepID=A7AWP1_BABBO|eukprot:XP_001609037.1 variant erythrocyte surface antigen-1, alpha subunit [Babesia bovis T2Bo]
MFRDSGSKQLTCSCKSGSCTAETCQCALAGKCCKCCCKDCTGKCNEKAKCSCVDEDKDKGTNNGGHRIYKDTYQSAYGEMSFPYIGDDGYYLIKSVWTDLQERGGSKTPSHRRHQCARILLGSVCLIWSGITYMHWTGKYAPGSPYWNNHIIDGTGLDDGTLSQWLQALGFPREMLNDAGPQNRLDKVIWDGLRDIFFLGFLAPGGLGHDVKDENGNTARSPFGMNYAGFVHTIHRDSFNTDQATVFTNGNASRTTGQISDTNQHKNGAFFKLYILSCAYFTGLQKRNSESTPRTPRTIREILYWLSALPYSQAYPKILTHSKGVLEKVAPDVKGTKTLSFNQIGLKHPITVDEYNLFAHFQAVTQYCPLVLIGIQGGIHSTKDTKEPAIHSLYSNTECKFTYPAVPIQAYNQVVHYIRGLFYQLYFLRKQCAVKVTCGGKWRECRYGQGVESKGVISWMCLGCNPMEHDRKGRVEKVKDGLDGVVENMNASEWRKGNETKRDEKLKGAKELITLLEAIGQVVVQLGNAQEALEGKDKDAVLGVKKALEGAKDALGVAKTALEEAVKKGGLDAELKEAKTKLEALTKSSGSLHKLANGSSYHSLH